MGIAAERVVSVTEVAMTVTCTGEMTPVGGVKVTEKACCADRVPVGPPLMAGASVQVTPAFEESFVTFTVIARVWFRLSSMAAAPVGETTSTLIPGTPQQPPPPPLLLPPPQPRRKITMTRPESRYFTKSFFSITRSSVLKAQFQGKLHGARTMSIDRMQKRVAGQAIGLRVAGCVE